MTENKTKKKKKKENRRGNHEGSIYYRDDGRWAASVTIGYDADGKRIRKMFYGKTRSEVAIKMTSALNESMVYGNVSFTNDTLQILMEEWLRVFKKAEVTTRTYEGAKLRAQNHIYPYMGGMKLRDVNTSTIQGLLNKMIFDGYALATIRKVKFLLNQFFNYAKKFKFVKENPVDECIVKSNSAHKEQKKEDYKAIPIEAREKFIEALNHNETMKPICMTLLFAGLRIGEALALKWKDVCFNDKTIIIDNAITEILEYDREDKIVGRKTVISDTKTAASVRVVPMPDVLVEILEQWKKRKEWLEKTTKISMTKPEDIVIGHFGNQNTHGNGGNGVENCPFFAKKIGAADAQ